MNYTAACQALAALRPARVRLGLERIQALLARLDHPERRFRSVLVVGTNGKGSTAAMVESIARQAGYRTGLYTSPHLVEVRERIALDGRPIDGRRFARLIEQVLRAARRLPNALGPVTYFEALTAAGFAAFAQAGVDLAVVEVGLGGRFDATNALDPELVLLTSISLDHQEYLGATVARIAAEKAGVLRGQPLIAGRLSPVARAVVRRRCRAVGSGWLARGRTGRLGADRWGRFRFTWSRAGRTLRGRLALPGRHQVDNAALALAAIQELGRHGIECAPDACRRGLRRAVWPGRLDWRAGAPPLLLDGAHNRAGMQALTDYLDRFVRDRPIVALYAITRRRAARGLLARLEPRLSRLVLTRVPGPRGVAPWELLAEARRVPALVEPDPRRALARARRLVPRDGVLLVTGSLYLVGEVMALRARRRGLLAA